MMEKQKALEMALSQIEKQFGKGAVMKLGDAAAKISISTIPSGCLELDYALGVGGIPRGRIIEIYGPESSGKTTIALHAIAEAQKLGGTAAFIDAEHALDPVYAENLGVDVDELYISQPDTGEQALEIAEALCRSGAIDIVVIDSVAARVAALAIRYPAKEMVLTGGLCDSLYFIKVLSQKSRREVTTHPFARYAGALGAALTAAKKSEVKVEWSK